MPAPTPRRRPADGAPLIAVCHMADVPDAHYVGRAWAGRAATPLGNPFRGEGAIDRYDGWLRAAFKATYGDGPATAAQSAAVLAVLDLADVYRETGRLELGCWCAPEPCHADVVARAVLGVLRRDAQYVRLADGWARIDFEETDDGLPFVVTRDGAVLGFCASHAAARDAAAGRVARRQLADDARVEMVNGAGILEDD